MARPQGGIRPDQVDYINAHGTSTPYNDKLETLAIKNCFGDHARKLAISSTKSMTGHLLGGAGGLEAGISALAVFTGEVPPTINLDNPDPECDLDYVPHKSRKMPVRYALSNSFGFGGTNAALLFKKFEVRREAGLRPPATMKIAVCIKQVPTREWQPRLNDDKTWIREQDVSYEMNEPDAYALEEALRLREKHGGEVVVCSRRAGACAAGDSRGAGARRRSRDSRRGRPSGCGGRVRDGRRAGRGDGATSGSTSCSPACSRTISGRRRRASSWPSGSASRTPRSSWRSRSQGRRAAREARARRRLVPVDRHAAAGAAHHPERHQPAALRHAEGHHGGEEEGDPEGGACRRTCSRRSRSSRLAVPTRSKADAHDRGPAGEAAKELVRRLREEARVL